MKTRVISAIVALIIIIPIIFYGGIVFEIGVAVIGLIGLWELLKLREGEKKFPLLIKGITFLSFLAIVILNTGYSNNFMVDLKYWL